MHMLQKSIPHTSLTTLAHVANHALHTHAGFRFPSIYKTEGCRLPPSSPRKTQKREREGEERERERQTNQKRETRRLASFSFRFSFSLPLTPTVDFFSLSRSIESDRLRGLAKRFISLYFLGKISAFFVESSRFLCKC